MTKETGDWRPEPKGYVVPKELRIPPGHETITEAFVQDLETRILEGESPESAKCNVGIRPRLWKQWREAARCDKQPFWQLFERVKLATTYTVSAQERTVVALADHEDPAIAGTYATKVLAWRRPSMYAPQSRQKIDARLTVSGRVDLRAVQVLATLTPEQIAASLGQDASLSALVTAPTPSQIEAEEE